MKQLEFDVAVIGGGPAGTVAAIASARRTDIWAVR